MASSAARYVPPLRYHHYQHYQKKLITSFCQIIWRRKCLVLVLGSTFYVIVFWIVLYFAAFSRKYVPNKRTVVDMCLFADVIKDFTHLKECKRKHARYNWNFNCKLACPMWNLTTQRQNEQRTLYIPCQNTVVKGVRRFNYGNDCLLQSLQKQCTDGRTVPNVVHYMWLGDHHKFQFHHFLSVYSVYKIQKPCAILIHGETLPYGQYWDTILRIVRNIVLVYRTSPVHIYNKKIKHIEHKADIARLEALRDYGGIYLDTDTVILRSLQPLRKFNVSMSLTRNDTLGNGLILSAKNATFIDIWLRHYVTFNPEKWGEHSVYLPFRLSQKFQDHIHVENRTFLHGGTLDQLFMSNFKWSHLYAIHLYIRYYTKCPYNEDVIGSLNTTMGSVARYVLFGSKELCTV